MEKENLGSEPETETTPEDPPVRWCPVCRKEVRVKRVPLKTGRPAAFRPSDADPEPGEAPADGPRDGEGMSFKPLCSNCDVCLLKVTGAQPEKKSI